MAKIDPHGPHLFRIHTPQSIGKKFSTVNLVGDPYICAKFTADPSYAYAQMGEI